MAQLTDDRLDHPRDRQRRICPPGAPAEPGSGSLALYSGVNTGTFDFHKIFKTVQ
jgi:hypothetical protein